MKYKENNRPLSPHLSVYKYQITSVLSIFHRITGIILFFSLIVISWWLIIAITKNLPQCYFKLFNCKIIQLGLFGILFSLFYHSGNGIRHLCWDLGYGFQIKTVEKTGWIVITVSTISTVLFWLRS